MSSDFKPSTRRLIQLLGWEAERFSNAQAENYRNEAWPVDPVLAAALRQALGEHPEGGAGEDRARIDAWLAKPLTAYGKFDSIVHALFDHENRLAPPVVIEEVSQSDSPSETLIDVTEGIELTMQVDGGTRTFSVEGDPQLAQEGVRVDQHDGRRIVRFRHAGKTHGFFVESRGTWMDFPAVLQGVDAFMTDLGRPVPAAERLGLPLSRQRREPPAPAA